MPRLCVLLLSALVLTGVCGAQAPRTGAVNTPDVRLATFTYGAASAAAPVIVVNGGPGLSHVYLVQNDVWTRRVAAHRQVVMYDQRGTGASPLLRPSAPQTMEAQVADLEAVRASLGRDKVHFVGDSYGGLLASAYAAAHPEHVLTLTLSDSAAPGFAALHPRLGEAFPDVEAATKEKIAALKGPNAQAEAAELDLRAHFRMIFYSPELAERYLAHATDLGLNEATGEAVSQAIEKLDLTQQMAQFRFPVLVMQGRYDLNVTTDVAWRVAHNVPGATLHILEHSGHLPYYEEPEEYTRVVEGFFAQHEGATR